jgi:hypothetical protein
MATYYKVVYVDFDDGCNWKSAATLGAAELRYVLCKRTVPNFGRILAFTTLEAARRFLPSIGDYLILRGRGRKGHLSKRRWDQYWDTPTGLKHAWRPGRVAQWDIGNYAEWPTGTVALDWFVPLEVVE